METMRLTETQSLRIANLPAGYRVVGIDRGAPCIRKPSGQLQRITRDGRLVSATLAAMRGFEARGPTHPGEQTDELRAVSPYTSVMD
jgi:hypothetical protein